MWNTIAWVAVASLIIASAMEFLKHTVYNDRATFKQMTLLGILFSIILTPLIYYGFGLLGTVWAYACVLIHYFLCTERNRHESCTTHHQKITREESRKTIR